MKRDEQVFEIIQKEKERQMHGIELIASENFVSPQVLEAMGSVMTNKYAEGYPGKRYYGGCQFVDMTEQLAIDRIKQLYGAEYANVQPHSGAQANMAVFFTCLKPGETFMGLDLAHGGHLSHGSPVNMSGILYNAVSYQVSETTGMVDYDAMEKIALEHKPKLLVAGASAYSREWDYERMRAIADKIGAIFMVDMAHPAGLIAAGLLKNPVKYAHIVTSTTHKTLRGPRGGIILTNNEEIAKNVDRVVFPGIQGGPLMHIIAAKAAAFKEALTEEFVQYQKQVVANAKVFANKFIELGYHVVSNGTDNHLLLLDVLSKANMSGKKAENLLDLANITCNKNTIPYDTKKPFITSGIRLGTPAMTTRGFKEEDFIEVAILIDMILMNPENEEILEEVKRRVKTLTDKYPLQY